jgi:hypothetical protein
MRANRSLLFPVIFLCLSVCSYAQSWSGIISPSRAVDWSQAGIQGGVPDGSWPQCGSTIAAGATAGTINAALASCASTYPSGSYVLLGPGTFALSAQINYPTSGHIVLRGSGANSTFITPTSLSNCSQAPYSSPICIQSNDGTYITSPSRTIYGWTAGYTQGSNQLTLSGTNGINSTKPTLLFLEQCDTGYTASSPTSNCSGSARDNSQLFICEDSYNSSGPTGCSIDGPDTGDPERGQMEVSAVSSVNSGNGVVTLANPLKFPNWTSGQTPRVWYAQPIVQVGLENLSLDLASTGGSGVVFFNAYQWWVSGVKIANFSGYGIFGYQSISGIVQSNYITHSTGPDSYGVRYFVASNNVMQNNIITQVFAPFVNDGPASGNVFGYNFIINDNYRSDYLRGSFFEHAIDGYELYEGNAADNQWNDGDHGTASMITRYRNFFFGWESCGNGQCGSATTKDGWTNSLIDSYGDRYQNNVANVMGTPGWHATYKSNAGGLGGGDQHVVSVPGPSQSGIPIDPLVMSTSMWWGNWDPATNATRWCGNSSDGGWSSTCNGTSEIPTGASSYPNSLPTVGDIGASQPELPASFYLSAQPSWFDSVPWPAIGPDVTGGNVGQCTGTLNTPGQFAGVAATSSSQCRGTSLATAWGGHVNAIPAMNCYLNMMGGLPDGTGGVLAFDASSCYGNAPPPPAPPTGLSAVVQ